MLNKIIDGKSIAADLQKNIAIEVEKIKKDYAIIPSLAVILIGNDPASKVYVGSKEKAAHKIGMNSITYKLSSDITQEELINKIEELNNNNKIHGILVQLPLPKHINTNTIIHTIDPKKDVDGFHVINVGKLSIGQISGQDKALIPCTPQGCLHLMKSALGNDLKGLDALVIGTSNIVGRPLARLLMLEKCTVTIANSRTKNLKEKCLNSDIIISATGVSNLITSDMVNENTTIIDVGINRITLEDGTSKLVGDVNFSELIKKVKFITPVPGGVGPMTISYLLKNTLESCKKFIT
jgi:methylenetetrahydrofolate dehydrogenase (NADP+) / methenyltetrahydrofolate cyclohydrolase